MAGSRPPSVYLDVPIAPDVRQTAEILGCHAQTVYAMIERGDLTAIRVGRLIRIPRHAILELLGESE